MQMNKSFLIAVILAAGTTAWILSGTLDKTTVQTLSRPPADLIPNNAPQSVRVQVFHARDYQPSLVLTGQSEAVRRASVLSETQGAIKSLPVEKGSFVTRGTVLARVAVNDRAARLAEAQALLAQREMEYNAARRLSKKGFRAETQLVAHKAALESAQARVLQSQLELDRTEITAPFDGVLHTRLVEKGSILRLGDSLGTLLDLSSIVVSAEVSERQIAQLSIGDRARVTLASGQTANGAIRFIAARANPGTRTFQIEVLVPNPDLSIPAGMTATLTLDAPPRRAHLVSPGILTLRDDGRVGVFVLTKNNRVRFVPADIIANSSSGLWLAGLPERTVLVTVGQEFIIDRQDVLPIDAQTLHPFQQDGAEK